MYSLDLNDNQILSLYLYLKKHEIELDDPLYAVLNHVEKVINGQYTIAELEELRRNYEDE